METEQLTRLLGDISAAGERVARSRNLRELTRFKMLVKRFYKKQSIMAWKQSNPIRGIVLVKAAA